MMYEEKSKAEEIREVIERQDEGLVDLLLSGEERQEPRLNEVVYCPLWKGDTIQVIESAEGDSERVFFQMKCLDCGCEFVLFEDDINACRRGIENAKAEIKYNENKIKYFEEKLRLDDREWKDCEKQSVTRLSSPNKKKEE